MASSSAISLIITPTDRDGHVTVSLINNEHYITHDFARSAGNTYNYVSITSAAKCSTMPAAILPVELLLRTASTLSAVRACGKSCRDDGERNNKFDFNCPATLINVFRHLIYKFYSKISTITLPFLNYLYFYGKKKILILLQ